jgi:hypothetical protein
MGADVIFIEPEPSNYSMLVRNLQLNDCKSFKALNVATGENEGIGFPYAWRDLCARLSPSLKRQIIRMLSEPYIEFVSFPFSKLRHLCRFEKGGYCKKIRAVCEAKKCPKIPKEQ